MINFHFIASRIIKNKIAGLKFGLLQASALSVQRSGADFDDAFAELEHYLRDKFSTLRPAEDETVKYVRRMYGRVGWEPTRYRPSSEALIRRILQGKGLYRINNLVDFGNIASARSHLPMGLYDASKISGTIVLDVGKEGESYRGISKPQIHARGKLILRDEKGIFGNPTADSLRTSITKETRSALAVFFCPPQIEDSYLLAALNFLSVYYKDISAGKEPEIAIIRFPSQE